VALDEIEKPIGSYEQALVICREVGDRRVEGMVLNNLGRAYFDIDEVGKAIGCYEQALVISREPVMMLAVMDHARTTGDRNESQHWTRNILDIEPVIRAVYPQTAQIFCNRWRKLSRTQRDQIATHSSHVLSIPVTFSQNYAGPEYISC